MVEVELADEFVKRYKLLPVVIQKKAEKQERLFRNNPFHPSLHTEKLEPRGKNNIILLLVSSKRSQKSVSGHLNFCDQRVVFK